MTFKVVAARSFAGLILSLSLFQWLTLAQGSGALKSFELVFYDPSKQFNGVTPFSVGPKSGFTTEMRMEYLRRYAKAIQDHSGRKSDYYAVDVVPSGTALELARQIKEKPLPRIRQTVPLRHWRWKLEPDLAFEVQVAFRDEGWTAKQFAEETTWNEMEAPRMFAFNRAVFLRTHFLGPTTQRVLLSVGSIIDEYQIWVNGRLAASHNGFEPVIFDITPYVMQGQDNAIAIRIEDKPKDHIGIADEITVVGVPDASLSDLFVKTERAQGRQASATVEVEITQRAKVPFQGRLKVEVLPWFPDERSAAIVSQTWPINAAAVGVGKVRQRIDLQGVDLWSPEEPHLYLVRARLEQNGGSEIDELTEVVGFRKIEQREGRLYLNGEPWFMKAFGDNLGFAPGYDNTSTICPPDEWIVRDLTLAKRANANAIRIHPWGFASDVGKYSDRAWPMWLLPNSATNYQRIAWIADQLGIGMIWGTRMWSTFGPDFQRKYFDNSWEARLEPSLRHIRNRPSILVYEGGNEIVFNAPIEGRGELQHRYEQYCRRYLELVNRIDDSRMVIPDTPWNATTKQLSFLPKELFTLVSNTVFTRHNYIGWYGSIPSTPLFDRLSERPLLLLECGTEAMPDWRLYRGLRWYGLWMNMSSPAGRQETAMLGRPLNVLQNSEVDISQANQALALEKTAYLTRFSPADGMSINLIADGLVEGNYHKGVCDIDRKAKLGFFAAQMIYQPVVAAGAGLDFVLGPEDQLHVQLATDSYFRGRRGKLELHIADDSGKVIDQHQWAITLARAERLTAVGDYMPHLPGKGFYLLSYTVTVE